MTSRPSTAAPILAALAIVVVTMGAYVGGHFWFIDVHPFMPVTEDTQVVRDIRTVEELDSAMRVPYAVIHIDVDWAMQAIQSRSVVRSFVKSASGQKDLADVVFYRLDCTEQDGPLWEAFTVWQEAEHSDPGLRFGGYGAMIWIANGAQKDAVQYAHAEGEVRLLQRTYKAFGKSP